MAKSGCYVCKYANFELDGCICEITGLLIHIPEIGCTLCYSSNNTIMKSKKPTNADKIRNMTDEELFDFIK